MKCPTCGHDQAEGARFCTKCGTALEHATARFEPLRIEERADVPSSLVADLAAGQALLVIERGPAAGSKFLLDRAVTRLGRLPENHVFLDDVTVSRRHAEIHRVGGEFVIRDVGSMNGTYLNGQRVDEAPLASSDTILIGRFRIAFLLGPAARERP